MATAEGFRGELLDNCLSMGYYRMQHLLFTCNETQTGEDSHTIPVFWLRTLVNPCKINRQARTINKKCAAFSVSIQPAFADEEIEELYALYSNHKPFSTSATCGSYLHQNELPNPFDTLMVQVRDGENLVAVGFFDEGQQAIAGIMNIYHPHYENYSLGKFLMLQKLQYAKSHELGYYYTGYISTGSTRFDYKTFPDPTAVEVYLPIERKWKPYHLLGKEFLEDYYMNYLV